MFEQVGDEFITARIKWEGELINRHDPRRDPEAFARDWAELKTGAGPIVANFEPNYEGSPIVFGPPGGVTGARGTYMFKARPGHHLAPRQLSSGRNLFEELGGSFVLLAFDAPAEAVRALEAAAASLRIPLKVLCDTFAAGREDFGARVVLVRPDQYVAWASDSAPPDAVGIIRRVAGLD